MAQKNVVRFYPKEKDTEVVEAIGNAKYATGIVHKENEDGTLDLIVSLPGKQNVERTGVSGEKDASPRFEYAD